MSLLLTSVRRLASARALLAPALPVADEIAETKSPQSHVDGVSAEALSGGDILQRSALAEHPAGNANVEFLAAADPRGRGRRAGDETVCGNVNSHLSRLLTRVPRVRTRGVGDFLLVEVDEGFVFEARVRIFRPALDDLAQNLLVVAVGRDFGVDLADIVLDGLLLFVQTLDALAEGQELFAAHHAALSDWGLARGVKKSSAFRRTPRFFADSLIRSSSSRLGTRIPVSHRETVA